jgi:CubicO group peptidase (beta-lactamase class C family)
MNIAHDYPSPSMRQASLSTGVDAVVEQAIEQQRMIGVVVMISRDGNLVYQRAAGLADREGHVPMREDTIFRLSSLTKPIVSATTLALVELGLLELDDPVARWLPNFRPKISGRGKSAMTVRHLMTHTAGLSYRFLQPINGPYEKAGVSDGISEPGLSLEDQLERLASVPLFHAPGTAWEYSLAIDVLGGVIAHAGDAPLATLVRKLVTAPLGMLDTEFAVRDVARLAAAYIDGGPPRRMQDPDVLPSGDGPGIHFSPSRILDGNSFASGGGGMAGTALDFMKFLEAVRQGGGAILTAQSALSMMSNQIGNLRINLEATPSWAFGYGGAVLMDPDLAGVPQSVGTWKWGGVYGHHWYVDPQRRLSVVALSNTTPEGMLGTFVTELLRAVYAAL